MSQSSFTQKLLRATFALGAQSKSGTTFGQTGSNTVTLDGLRMSMLMSYTGTGFNGQMQLRVWGMSIDQMNQLSSLGLPAPATGNNKVLVESGTSASAFASVFEGTILAAWADFESMPEVVFNVTASMGGAEALKPIPPLSYAGGTDVATIMAAIAKNAGWTFENNGVSGIMLSDPYLPGTATEQARRAAGAAGIGWVLDRNVLAIWPRGGSRGASGGVPLISPATGMKGYPTFTGAGITVTTLHNPALQYGGKFQLKSDLPQANGEWRIYGLARDLNSLVPGGDWLDIIQGWDARFGSAPIVAR